MHDVLLFFVGCLFGGAVMFLKAAYDTGKIITLIQETTDELYGNHGE